MIFTLQREYVCDCGNSLAVMVQITNVKKMRKKEEKEEENEEEEKKKIVAEQIFVLWSPCILATSKCTCDSSMEIYYSAISIRYKLLVRLYTCVLGRPKQ